MISSTARAVLTGALLVAVAGCSGSSHAPSKAQKPAAALSGRIAFRHYLDAAQTTGALITATPGGKEWKQITHPPAATVDDQPDWAPDGRRLVFSRITDEGGGSEDHRLFTVAADGTGLTALSPSRPARGNVVVGFDGEPAFSPDGAQIAFSFARGPVGKASWGGDQIAHSDVWLMNADGSHRHPVTRSTAFAGDAGGIAWSPDGSELVYARTNSSASKPGGGRALFIVNVDGSHERQLTGWSLGADGTPDWSSTDLIVFRAVIDEESGRGNFFTIHPDGTDLTQVTHFTDTVISHKVGFAPDGASIVFATQAADGTIDVFTAKTDGSDVHAVTASPYDDSSPDWGRS